MACEYCDDTQDKRIIDNDSVSVFIEGWRGQMVVNYYDQIWQATSKPIKYCTMCGEKLGDAE